MFGADWGGGNVGRGDRYVEGQTLTGRLRESRWSLSDSLPSNRTPPTLRIHAPHTSFFCYFIGIFRGSVLSSIFYQRFMHYHAVPAVVAVPRSRPRGSCYAPKLVSFTASVLPVCGLFQHSHELVTGMSMGIMSLPPCNTLVTPLLAPCAYNVLGHRKYTSVG